MHHLFESTIKYRFSKVKEPFYKDNAFMSSVKRPLDDQHIEMIVKDLDWTDFHWGEQSLIVKDVKYEPIKNYKYYPIKQ